MLLKHFWGIRNGFLLICTLGLLAACDQQDKTSQTPAAPPPSVTVAPIVSKQISTSLEYVGRTRANQQVELRARVTGFLLERPFKEGSDVNRGQLLYQIDPAEFEAAKKVATAGVERAQATLVDANKTLERSRTLAARGTVSQAKLDESTAAAAQAQADLAAAQADLTAAELNLGYTTITAPISGRIGATTVDAGNLVGPDAGVLATILDLNPIEVEFAISERQMLDYQQRKATGEARSFEPKLRLANDTMLETPGELYFIDNQVDPVTGTIKLRVRFPNAEGLVLPGQFVNVLLVSSEPRDEVVVPQAAVQTSQAGAFVLTVDADNQVTAKPVELGERSGRDIVVKQGVAVGEMLIVEGVQKVRPGAKVSPTVITPVGSDS
ncbi:efflux RND transporter periplasmic adaptor subunit [Limibacillus halophilus]|uniref:Membrane fusion protein (Multidrug efflux system) n=1 Tax=Limibacillus halophilus TaxID=1579333 RepID=A0A839SU22_9PROT|nr:efflux RND transporter periplasmic adaptor subunit [Limibacillus halophilus]MBB3066291.1 membrane fusion protein (multidrug efflux system) [Limibacillus halophilus]